MCKFDVGGTKSLLSLVLGCFLLCCAPVQASEVDITLVPTSGNTLEVKLRPSEGFDGLVSSIVFTIRWDASTDAHLGSIMQAPPSSVYLPMGRSGIEQDADGDRYQIFVGFGMTPMLAIPTTWVAGQEYSIMTISVDGAAEFSLVNDAWTGSNNANYYLALGGSDETGAIYGDISTGVTEGAPTNGPLQVIPNPVLRSCTILLELDAPQDLELELLNAIGQVVWKQSFSQASGTVRQPLDMQAYEKGVYLLRVHGLDQELSQRVVKH